MTATLLARKMMEGLSDTARDEMRAAMADLSLGGRGDLVKIFDALLSGQSIASALGLPAGTVDLLYAQAHARFNSGHVTDALGMFQSLTVLAPDVKDHWLGLGICLRLTDAFSGARLAFATALELAPTCPAVHFHLAELSFSEGKMDEAKALLQRFEKLPEDGLKTRLSGVAQRLAALVAARAA